MAVIENSSGGLVVDRPRVDWEDLRIFLVVADTKSFSAGARVLGLSQPTVSQRMRELEARLGAQLLVRTGNTLALTESGALICDHIRTMDRSAVAIERLVADQDRIDEGRVRITAPDGVAAFWLAPRLGEFRREHPKISLSIDAGLWPDDVVRDDVDISLQFRESKTLDHVVVPLAAFHYGVYASPEYLAMYGMPATFQELATHRAIHHTAQTRQKESWAPETSALQTLWANQLETNSSAAVVYAVRAGAGVAPLPTAISVVEPDLEMLCGKPLGTIRLFLVYHRDLAQIARIRRVIEWLKAAFDHRTQPWFRDEFVHPDEFRMQFRR